MDFHSQRELVARLAEDVGDFFRSFASLVRTFDDFPRTLASLVRRPFDFPRLPESLGSLLCRRELEFPAGLGRRLRRGIEFPAGLDGGLRRGRDFPRGLDGRLRRVFGLLPGLARTSAALAQNPKARFGAGLAVDRCQGVARP